MAWIALGAAGIGAAGSIFAGAGSGGGSEGEIKTKVIEDPLKKQVASAYAPYLAGQVGQGVGNLPVDPLYQSRYNDFMGVNPDEWFNKNYYDPALKNFKELQQPLIAESFAGNLRGSGHYTAQNEGVTSFLNDVGNKRLSSNLGITGAQLGAGQTYQKQAYDQWYNSLPQNNPALKQGLDFLSNNTNTGTTILSGLDPGQEGWMGDLLNTLVGGGASIYGSNQIAGALKSNNTNSNSSSLSSWFDQNQGNQNYYNPLSV